MTTRDRLAEALRTAVLLKMGVPTTGEFADALLPVVEQIAAERAAEELAELGRLLGHTPLSEREALRKGERMQVSDYTQGMHAASTIALSRAAGLTDKDGQQ